MESGFIVHATIMVIASQFALIHLYNRVLVMVMYSAYNKSFTLDLLP